MLFNSILRMIENAEANGVSRAKILRGVPSEFRTRLKDKRSVPVTFIGPQKHLKMDSLDFDPETMRAARKQGIAVGRAAVPKIVSALESVA